MFQDYALFPHMTVGQNVGYGLMVRGVAKAEIGRILRTKEVSERIDATGAVAAAGAFLGEEAEKVAAVVNEYGETIGILTFDDILDTVFAYHPTRSSRLVDRTGISPVLSSAKHPVP